MVCPWHTDPAGPVTTPEGAGYGLMVIVCVTWLLPDALSVIVNVTVNDPGPVNWMFEGFCWVDDVGFGVVGPANVQFQV